MPAWALHRKAFVYASERSGSSAIWMRGEDGDRPIVTADSFPRGDQKFIHPSDALSASRPCALHARQRRQRRSIQLDLVPFRRATGPADQRKGCHRARRFLVAGRGTDRLLAVPKWVCLDDGGQNHRRSDARGAL